jgi:hypothetical protein
MGLKVFLSYGHDGNTDLVLRIKRDLEAAGHHPWIDQAGIKTGDDWRRSILDGLVDTDWTLAFLSRHAVRESGVCLDEIALAMGMRHGNLATILAEPEDEVQAPVSVSHIQWLDMSGWAAQNDAWYLEKLQAILNLLADPETHRFRGEIEQLEQLLHPITQAADIPPLIDGFVGREWVVQKVDAWRRNDLQRRVFWLTGGPGAGKSAFTAWITHYQRGNVVCLNLCKWNDEDRSDPRRVLRTLAFLLATRLRDFRRRLLDRFRLHDPDGRELANKGAASMFHWLLAEPLQLIDGGRRRDRCVVVIDALDETLRDGVSELTDLLADLAPKLPHWIAVLLTSRPDFPIAASLSHIAPLRPGLCCPRAVGPWPQGALVPRRGGYLARGKDLLDRGRVPGAALHPRDRLHQHLLRVAPALDRLSAAGRAVPQAASVGADRLVAVRPRGAGTRGAARRR